MKKLIIGLLLISNTLIGQEYIFDIHNTSLSEYIELEYEIGSERLETTSDHISSRNAAQPIKFQRNEILIPDLVVYYFFSKKDSIISHIRYEWDIYNFEKQENNQKSEEFQKALISKYETLKIEISKIFGLPEIKKNYSNISRLDSINTFIQSSKWNPNDSTSIELYATVSNYYEKRGMSTINPTHRIRLNIRKKSKPNDKSSPKLDKNKISQLEEIKGDFFKALENKDLAKSKKFLSELIQESVTDEQLITLHDYIDFAKETELVYSGVQVGVDGSSFTMLQYKYSEDNSSPPSTVIKLLFDQNDKVVGIQPVVRQKISNN